MVSLSDGSMMPLERITRVILSRGMLMFLAMIQTAKASKASPASATREASTRLCRASFLITSMGNEIPSDQYTPVFPIFTGEKTMKELLWVKGSLPTMENACPWLILFSILFLRSKFSSRNTRLSGVIYSPGPDRYAPFPASKNEYEPVMNLSATGDGSNRGPDAGTRIRRVIS